MDSNKEEARRALDYAERKLSKNDYNKAKKLAHKAQRLYPRLDGLEQLLMMIDVYVSASKKINGEEFDWYGILGVDPLADDETVKKRYKKLALCLHPDKNRFHGAEGAFKLVLDAWLLLSDKPKRFAYDQKCGIHKHNKPPEQDKPPSYYRPPSYYSYCRPTSTPKPKPTYTPKPKPTYIRKPKTEPEMRDPMPKFNFDTSSTPVIAGTFWTVCNRCKTYCEFVWATYLNRTSPCPNCGQCFVAAVITPEVINGRLVIRLSPSSNQSTWRSTSETSSTSASHDNAKAKTSGPERMKRWFEPMTEHKPELDSSVNKEKKVCTFWTVCNRCKTHYKLVKADSLNKILPCPNCSQEFVAAEMIPEIINGGPVIILCSSVQSTSKKTCDASSTTSTPTNNATTSTPTNEMTAEQREKIMKRWFPGSRHKIAADFAAAASGGNAKEAERLYKKMTTRNTNSSFKEESRFEEPMTTCCNENSTHEAERLFKKPMATGNNTNSSFTEESHFK